MRWEPALEPERRARWAVAGGFALLTVFFTGSFPPFANPNELSRLETVYAIVEEGTFRIDGALKVLGDHEDKAEAGGHLYSNKAPGLAFAAVPVYRLLRVALPAPVPSRAGPFFNLLRLLTVGLLCIAAVWRLACRLPGRAAPLMAGAVALGTPFLYYARSFLSHAWSAALLFLAWDLLRRAQERLAHRRVGALVAWSGFLAGWALISEYTVAPIVVLLVLRAGARREYSRILLCAAGAAVPVALLFWYQAVCFGSPLTPSYAKEAFPAYAQLAHRPLLGFGLPSPRVLFDYLFHPARGLLVFSPFLAWAGAGFVKWWRSREDRADCLVALAGTAAFLLLLSAYPNWHGGWSLGSRYLLPLIFFLALAAARALDSPASRGLFAAAAVFSIGNHAILSLTWPHFPANIPWPAATASLWFLERGWVAQSLLDAGAPAARVVAVLVGMGVAVAGAALCLAAAGLPAPRRALAAALGLAPLAVLLVRPPELTYGGRLWRAAVYVRFSGLDPSGEQLRKVAATASTASEKQRAEDAWRLFGPESRTPPSTR
ncbi:MAG: hypothetical protein ACRD00_07035 [Thermoanaerobaculia bacterium]